MLYLDRCLAVIPGRAAGASPESNSLHSQLDSGLAASRRPGMTKGMS
jgi:hypothetical protein